MKGTKVLDKLRSATTVKGFTSPPHPLGTGEGSSLFPPSHNFLPKASAEVKKQLVKHNIVYVEYDLTQPIDFHGRMLPVTMPKTFRIHRVKLNHYDLVNDAGYAIAEIFWQPWTCNEGDFGEASIRYCSQPRRRYRRLQLKKSHHVRRI
jgi:hypothetical protein